MENKKEFNFCPFCGSKIHSSSKFCPECGEKLSVLEDKSQSIADENIHVPDSEPKKEEYSAPWEQSYSINSNPKDNVSCSEPHPKNDVGCGIAILVIFFGLIFFILSMAGIQNKSNEDQNNESASIIDQETEGKKGNTDNDEISKIDYEAIGHDYSILFVKFYLEKIGVTKYDKLGWYYPENYTVKDGVHYTSSKVDYNGLEKFVNRRRA